MNSECILPEAPVHDRINSLIKLTLLVMTFNEKLGYWNGNIQTRYQRRIIRLRNLAESIAS